jgi:hypothetical protein
MVGYDLGARRSGKKSMIMKIKLVRVRWIKNSLNFNEKKPRI